VEDVLHANADATRDLDAYPRGAIGGDLACPARARGGRVRASVSRSRASVDPGGRFSGPAVVLFPPWPRLAPKGAWPRRRGGWGRLARARDEEHDRGGKEERPKARHGNEGSIARGRRRRRPAFREHLSPHPGTIVRGPRSRARRTLARRLTDLRAGRFLLGCARAVSRGAPHLADCATPARRSCTLGQSRVISPHLQRRRCP